ELVPGGRGGRAGVVEGPHGRGDAVEEAPLVGHLAAADDVADHEHGHADPCQLLTLTTVLSADVAVNDGDSHPRCRPVTPPGCPRGPAPGPPRSSAAGPTA